MQLTKFSDNALRILLHLAAEPGRHLSVRDIAQAQGVSFNHLAKIGQWLAAEGYVKSMRGRGGGMQLAMDPSDISVGTLLRESEASSPLVECQRADGGTCRLTPACGLLPVLAEAQEAFFVVLDNISLADVLGRRQSMLKLLKSLHPSAA